MPTDLPPDYKPKPADDPNNPADPNVPGAKPAFPPERSDDLVDVPGQKPLYPGADVIDPGPGWKVPPPIPRPDGTEDPAPADAPSY